MGLEGPIPQPDETPILISSLEHWSYCPRQCALIHLEQTFDENIYTLKGRMLHERVDEPGGGIEAGVRVERAVPLWSKRLGLTGKADSIEFQGMTPYPVEFKHGKKKKWGHDDLQEGGSAARGQEPEAADIQLCAQALCLEEMLGVPVPLGAIYHHGSRRRREVIFDEALRLQVVETVEAVRAMLKSREIPPPANDARCENCSLKDSCMPAVVGGEERIKRLGRDLFIPTGI